MEGSKVLRENCLVKAHARVWEWRCAIEGSGIAAGGREGHTFRTTGIIPQETTGRQAKGGRCRTGVES